MYWVNDNCPHFQFVWIMPWVVKVFPSVGPDCECRNIPVYMQNICFILKLLFFLFVPHKASQLGSFILLSAARTLDLMSHVVLAVTNKTLKSDLSKTSRLKRLTIKYNVNLLRIPLTWIRFDVVQFSWRGKHRNLIQCSSQDEVNGVTLESHSYIQMKWFVRHVAFALRAPSSCLCFDGLNSKNITQSV